MILGQNCIDAHLGHRLVSRIAAVRLGGSCARRELTRKDQRLNSGLVPLDRLLAGGLLSKAGIVSRDTPASLNLQEIAGVLRQSLQCAQITLVSFMAIRSAAVGTVNVPP